MDSLKPVQPLGGAEPNASVPVSQDRAREPNETLPERIRGRHNVVELIETSTRNGPNISFAIFKHPDNAIA
jgi:hypothetical protein